MNRAVLSAEEEAQGCVLACKAYPQSDLSVTALGRKWQAHKEHGTAVWRQLLFPMATIRTAAHYTAAGSVAARGFDFAPAALAR
jgi:hypothetical protein